MNTIDLNERVAVVTGGAQGIGLATAKLLRSSGAKVALWDVEPGALADAKYALNDDVLVEALDLRRAGMAGWAHPNPYRRSRGARWAPVLRAAR